MIHCNGPTLEIAIRFAIPFIRRGARIVRCVSTENGRWTVSLEATRH